MPTKNDIRRDYSIIALYRAKVKMSQADLARHCGVSRSTINRLERGNRLPSDALLTAISSNLGYPRDQIAPLIPVSRGD